MPETRRPVPHVILVGPPGAGKSAVGEAAATRLGRPFLDFDVEIERRTGSSVADIFRDRGEPYFRTLELDLTRQLAGAQGAILAPGAGWIAVPGALELLRPPARMIYLRASPDVALLRMGRAQAARPLLNASDPLDALRRLLLARAALYETADAVVDVDRIEIEEVADAVARLVAGFRWE